MKNNEFRCHPTIIVGGSFKVIVFLLIFIMGDFSEMFVNEDGSYNKLMAGIALAAVFVIAGAFIISRFFAWKRTFISLTEEKLVYDKRTLIFKKKVDVRLSGISTVNLEKKLLDRIFGTYTVKLDINSSATADNTDFHLVFGEEFAKQFAEQILNAKKQNRLQNVTTDPYLTGETVSKDVTPVLQFKIKNILIHSLLMTSALSLVFLGALFAGAALPLFEISPIFYTVVALVGLPAAFVLSFVVSLIKNIFLYYNFTVSKSQNEVVVAYGLITRRIYRLPLSKTNGIIVKQSFFGRIFGMYYAEIINVGMGESEEKIQPIFCLMLNKKQMEWALDTLVPEFSAELKTEKSPLKAFVPVALKGFFLLLIFAVATVIICLGFKAYNLMVIALSLCVLGWLIISFACYRAKGLSTYNNKLVIATGVFARRIIIVPFKKIQHVGIKQGPVSKALNINHGYVTVLSSSINRNNYIGYFPPENFWEIAKRIG